IKTEDDRKMIDSWISDDLYKHDYDNLDPTSKKIIDGEKNDRRSAKHDGFKPLKGKIFLLNHTNKVVDNLSTLPGASAMLNANSDDVEAGNVIYRRDRTILSCYKIKNVDNKKLLSEWQTNPSIYDSMYERISEVPRKIIEEQLQVERVDGFIAERNLMR
ncbi:hypothetical protein CHS0354_037854, partial [Potamilus streckersoni]